MSAELKAQIGRRLREIHRRGELTWKELATKTVGKAVSGKLSDALAIPLTFFFEEQVGRYRTQQAGPPAERFRKRSTY